MHWFLCFFPTLRTYAMRIKSMQIRVHTFTFSIKLIFSHNNQCTLLKQYLINFFISTLRKVFLSFYLDFLFSFGHMRANTACFLCSRSRNPDSASKVEIAAENICIPDEIFYSTLIFKRFICKFYWMHIRLAPTCFFITEVILNAFVAICIRSCKVEWTDTR